MYALSLTWALCLLCISRSTLAAPTLVADLDYGTFEGSYSSKYNISYWQKIPFAAPPVGNNRFRGPQPPDAITNGTYTSTQTFDMCPQRTVNGSEDCLFLGLYGRPWTTGQPLRPVVVVFFGGGFIEGDAFFTIPPAGYPVLNVSTSNDLIFVYPNYRTNAFGLLPGSACRVTVDAQVYHPIWREPQQRFYLGTECWCRIGSGPSHSSERQDEPSPVHQSYRFLSVLGKDLQVRRSSSTIHLRLAGKHDRLRWSKLSPLSQDGGRADHTHSSPCDFRLSHL